MSYDLQAEGVNGTKVQTTVVALTGFASEFNIAVWNVDATAAPAIDAVHGFTSGGAIGIHGRSDANGVGVRGEVTSGTGDGVQGQGSGRFSGVAGFGGNVDAGQTAGTGVFGIGGIAADTFTGGGAPGVRGIGGGGPNTSPLHAVGVYGQGGQQSPGVVGQAGSEPADGVQGHGSGNFSGVAGFGGSNNGTGVIGFGGGSAGSGIRGIGAGGPNTDPGAAVGVYGQGGTGDAPGVLGQAGSAIADGVRGFSASGSAVSGESNNGVGVRAFSGSATGLVAEGDTSVPGTIGLIAAGNAFAGQFNGNVQVNGTLFKSAGGFKIDHPLEPNNKYLCHSFVESPEMLNVYSGTVTLNSNGEAPVVLPKWFEALNNDFRYQLTCVGAFAPVYVGEEIKGGTFKIAGGDPGMKVCWQVTGVRHDAYAQQNRLRVEMEKSKREQELRLGA